MVDGITLLLAKFQPLKPAPTILNRTVNVLMNSVTIQVALDSDGIVYCAAFDKYSVSSVTTSLIMRMGQQASTSGRSVYITIGGLIPATPYSIYCLSVSTSGVITSQADAFASRVDTVTLCCKLVTVDLLTPRLRASQVQQNAIVVTVESASSTFQTIVNLYLTPKSTLLLNPLYPSRIVVDAGQGNLGKSISYSININAIDDEGSYELKVLLGSIRAEYEVVFSRNSSFSVVNAQSQPP
jgi:hypothetical protein